MIYDSNGFAALADPTRKRVFELVSEQPRSVAQLSRLLPVSQPAVSHHLRVLKEAGLVKAEPRGASNIYHVDPHGLGQMRTWLDRMWEVVFERFTEELNKDQGEPHDNPDQTGPDPQAGDRRCADREGF